jgi:glycosyltransferase involved in cell wall biosynthesis/SAM-dependent methyltransferase
MSASSTSVSSLGTNVAGFLRGGLGLGQAARLYVAALQEAGVPVATTSVDVRLPEVRGAVAKTTHFTDLQSDAELPFNLVCVNAPELPGFVAEVGREFFQERHTIGVWAWETDVVPASWDRAFGLVDEIWVYSSYVVELLSHAAPCPVVRVPLPIEAPVVRPDTERTIDLPDGFTFLFVFDFFSTLQRKNPLGLVDAFSRAFRPGEGPHLLIKSFNGDYKRDALERLRAAAGDRPDIHIVDRFVSEPERAVLMDRCDAYVSLHRSEGFGLTLGEAMALGKPVIGTAYGGNVDFMSRANSYLVDYEMTKVGPEGENYPADGNWAEPDLDHAAALMREVWESQDEARTRGARARGDIARDFSTAAVGEVARARLKRLARIGRNVGRLGPPAPGAADTNGLMPESWLERVEMKLTYNPERDAAEKGGAQGLVRRTALQAMRPYTYHQDELNSLVANALREMHQRFDDIVVDTQAEILRLQGQVKTLRAIMPDVDADTAVDASDLARVLEGARARPGSTHPAISYVDQHGRRALGFRREGDDEAEGYRGFEDIFRGSEGELRAQQEMYLDLFAGREWVLDIGCGRGEFLDGLRERGIGSRGVDLDPTMVERCREKGHSVELADAASHLRTLDDDSVPGVFAAQVIEHLSADQLNELFALVHAKLAPGGLAVFETVNPHSPPAMKAFWTDVTHHHPLFPEVTLALCRLAGFDSGEVVFPHRTDDFDRDIYDNRDYALLVRKRDGAAADAAGG